MPIRLRFDRGTGRSGSCPAVSPEHLFRKLPRYLSRNPSKASRSAPVNGSSGRTYSAAVQLTSSG